MKRVMFWLTIHYLKIKFLLTTLKPMNLQKISSRIQIPTQILVANPVKVQILTASYQKSHLQKMIL